MDASLLQNQPQPAVVGLAKCPGYDDQAKLTAAIETALAPCGGIENYVHPGDRVLLKVNLVAPAKSSEAVTTHPEFVRSVIRLVKKAGGIVRVGDGPGVGDTQTAMRASGILAVVQEEQAEMAVFAETATYENMDNTVAKRLSLTSELQNCDVLITLPKLKTHVQMAFTGAVKNQFGLIPGSAKGQFHFRFQDRDRLADLFVDINRTARTRLAIMDAIIGMEGNGPSGGDPRFLGAVLASADLPGLDVVACELIGLSPESNPLNLAARRANWGTTRLQDIKIAGDGTLEELRCPDYKLVKAPINIMRILPLPNYFLKFIRRQYAPSPVIDINLCRRCGRCANGCPVKPAAINPWGVTTSKRLNNRTCIRCYCCHEFCPVKAISLRKSFLARLLPLPALANFAARILGKIYSLRNMNFFGKTKDK